MNSNQWKYKPEDRMELDDLLWRILLVLIVLAIICMFAVVLIASYVACTTPAGVAVARYF